MVRNGTCSAGCPQAGGPGLGGGGARRSGGGRGLRARWVCSRPQRGWGPRLWRRDRPASVRRRSRRSRPGIGLGGQGQDRTADLAGGAERSEARWRVLSGPGRGRRCPTVRRSRTPLMCGGQGQDRTADLAGGAERSEARWRVLSGPGRGRRCPTVRRSRTPLMCGGQGQDRTADLRFFRPALSQLSYLTVRNDGGDDGI
jgi:hypothetical protein